MQIEFKKGKEKDTLSCTRPDGSITWMTTTPFFTAHDLAHYVVETKLIIDTGFYGMLANGMDITDFENKQKFKPSELPAETIHVEHLVNLLLTEISSRRQGEDLQNIFDEVCRNSGLPQFSIGSKMLDEMRSELNTLLQRWTELPEGQTLQFYFKTYEDNSR